MAGSISVGGKIIATHTGPKGAGTVDLDVNSFKIGGNTIASHSGVEGAGVVTLQNATVGSGVVFPNFIPEIIAAARFDGSDGSSISLFNFNEPTRNGIGDYSLTFSSARSSVDFLIFHTGIDSNNNYLDHLVYSVSINGFSLEYRKNGNAEDVTESNVIVLKFPIT